MATPNYGGMVTDWFQQSLGRAPQQGGLDYWTGQLQSGRTPQEIQGAIAGSPEAQQYAQQYPTQASPMQGIIDQAHGAFGGLLEGAQGLFSGRSGGPGVSGGGQYFTGETGEALQGLMNQPSYFTGEAGDQLQNIISDPGYLQGEGAEAFGQFMGAPSFYEQGGPQQQSLDFLMSGDVMRAESNPYLQSYMQAASQPLIQQFQEQIIPGLRNQFAQAGQYSSSRQGLAEGIAGRGLADAIARSNLGLASQGYSQGLEAMMGGLGMGQGASEQALQRQAQGLGMGQAGQEAALARGLEGLGLGAAGSEQALQRGFQGLGMGQQDFSQAQQREMQAQMANQQAAVQRQQMGLQGLLGGLGMSRDMAGLGLMPSQALGQIGAQRQQQQQQAINDAMARWQQAQQAPRQSLQDYAGIISGTIPGTGGTSTTTTSGVGGGVQGALAGGLGGLALGGQLADIFSSQGGGNQAMWTNPNMFNNLMV